MREINIKKRQSKKEMAIFIALILISGTFLSLITNSTEIQIPGNFDSDVDGIGSEPDLNPSLANNLDPTPNANSDSQRGAETSVVRTAIRKGLDYLVTTQADDGGWDTINYGKPVALGGFGLRAFLDYQTLGESTYAESLYKSLQFLKDSCHDPEAYPPGSEQDYWGGLIHNDKYDPVEPGVRLYSHGSATLALIDYYWATKDQEVLLLVQNAVDLIFRAQHTEFRPTTLGGPVSPSAWHYGGWRYTPDFSNSDMSLTGWQVLALVSAREIGINIPDSALEAAKVFIDNCFNPDGAVSYTPGGSKASDLTAIAVFCLLLMGENVTSDPNIELGLEFLRQRPPIWEIENPPEHVQMPFYYWYYATQVWYQVGGEDWIWWNSSVTDMLIDWQNEDGSWDANQFEGQRLGKDFTTALAILILQISRRGVYLRRWTHPDTGVGEILQKETRLRGNVSYNLTVTSVGKGILVIEEDNITLTISNPPEGWNAYLETPTPNDPIITPEGDKVWWVLLSSMETANITLHVEAPDVGDIGDICYVVVNAWSSENKLATDSLTTTTYLVIDLDFSLRYNIPVVKDQESDHYGEKWLELAPGAKTRLQLTLKNLGELNDTYNLRIEGIRPGWETKFVESGLDTIDVELDADIYKGAVSTKDLNISVEVPADAQAYDVAVIKVVGESVYSHENTKIGVIVKEDMVILTTSEKLGIAMGCEEPLKYLNPGGNATYNITIYNLGNYQITVDLSNSEITSGWDIEYTKNIVIYNEASARVLVRIQAPENALSGSRLMITIKGTTVGGDVEFTESLVLTAIVNLVSNINAYMTPSTISIDPGGTVQFDVSIENLGNGQDTIYISPQMLDPNWEMQFLLNGSQETKFEMEFGESEDFKVIVITTADADPGTHILAVNITSTTQIIILYANIIINQIFEVSIKLYDEDIEQYVDQMTKSTSPSQSLTFLLEVRNWGNGPDTVELSIDSMLNLAEEWDIFFNCVTNTRAYSPNIVTKDFDKLIDARYLSSNEKYLCDEDTKVTKLDIKMNKDQKIWVSLTAGGPSEPIETKNTFKITAESEGQYLDDPFDNEVTLKITLLFPDLAFTGGIVVPRQMKHGELTSISVNIKNVGEFEANDFIVTLKIDNRAIKSVQISKIIVDGEVLLTFIWQAVGGGHEVIVEIDPDNRIIEKNDQFRGLDNNLASRNIDVESQGPLGSTDVYKTICGVVLIIIIIIIIIAMITVLKNRGLIKLKRLPKLKLKKQK